jgi:hypothetical protein
MRSAVLVLMALLAIPLVPVGSSAFSPGCVPTSDSSATSVDAGPGGHFYTRVYKGQGNWVEIWEETNGVSGLQHDPSWNCGGPGDSLVGAYCVATPRIGPACPAIFL